MKRAITVGTVLLATAGLATGCGSAHSSASGYISKLGHDATLVSANVLAVQLDVAQKSPVDQLAEDAQTAHDNLDNIRNDFAEGDDSGSVGYAETEAWDAANGLKNAMGSLVAWTGDPNPARLAHFSSQYQSARAKWNASIIDIWRAAGRKGAPTIA